MIKENFDLVGAADLFDLQRLSVLSIPEHKLT